METIYVSRDLELLPDSVDGGLNFKLAGEHLVSTYTYKDINTQHRYYIGTVHAYYAQ